MLQGVKRSYFHHNQLTSSRQSSCINERRTKTHHNGRFHMYFSNDVGQVFNDKYQLCKTHIITSFSIWRLFSGPLEDSNQMLRKLCKKTSILTGLPTSNHYIFQGPTLWSNVRVLVVLAYKAS